jgi:6-pyruvoyltetrahydropterin/6-carboxytetrahydropterin synthase
MRAPLGIEINRQSYLSGQLESSPILFRRGTMRFVTNAVSPWFDAARRGIMFEVTVEDSFAAGHYLRNYKGKCENPHGHNYKIRVTLAGAELDKAGLLLDFKDLREVMKHVIERLDHQMINDVEPFTTINPSAENLAKYFYDESNHRLQRVTDGRVRVKDVTVFETDTTTAKYSE